jgi:uncharacterized protein involved in exopolysaccharide biosynthesis
MPSPTDNNTLSLQDIVAIIRRRRWQIMLIFAIAMAAVVTGTLLMPKQYESRMKVLVMNKRADMIVSPERADASGYPAEVSEAQINSEIELLTSDSLLRQVVLRCGLGQREREKEGPIATERAVRRLQRDDLKISPVRKADIIQVAYTDPDPRRAVAVLTTLTELYLEEHLKVHGTPGTYSFFNGQAEHYQGELKDADRRLADFRRSEDIVQLDQQKAVMVQKAAESEALLMQAEAAVSEYSQKIAASRRELASAAPRVVTQTRTSSNQYSVERLYTMLAELQNRRTQLLAKFRPDDRSVQEVEREIADTSAALEKATKLTGLEQSTDINATRQALEIDVSRQQAELAGLKSRRNTLALETGTYRQQMMKLANATAQFDELVRAQKEAEENYLLYARKTEEARIAESLDRQKIANVAIAETPMEPHLPSKPNLMLNFSLGGLLSVFLSLGLAFAAESLHETIDEARELEELTGLPVLATCGGR